MSVNSINCGSPLLRIIPMDLPPVSTVTANVHVKIPTAEKKPQMTGKGRNEPKLANRKTPDRVKSVPLKQIPMETSNPNVAKKAASFCSGAILSS